MRVTGGQSSSGGLDPVAADLATRLNATTAALCRLESGHAVMAERLREEAAHGHDKALRAATFAVVAAAGLQDGHAVSSVGDIAGSAAAMFDGLADHEIRPHLAALGLLGWVETTLCGWSTARGHLLRAVALHDDSAPTTPPELSGLLSEALGTLAIGLGELTDGISRLDQALIRATNPDARIRALARLVWAWTLRGRLDHAFDLAGRVSAGMADTDPRTASLARGMVAQMALHTGDLATCARLLTDPGDPDMTHADPVSRVCWLHLLAAVAMLRQDSHTAVSRATRCAEAAATVGLPFTDAIAALAVSQERSVLDPTGSLPGATEAMAGFDRLGAPLHQAYAHLQLGQVHERLGDTAAALSHYGKCHMIFVAHRADMGRDQVERDQRRLITNLATRSVPGDPFTALTNREREVALLVGAGLSNRSIAQTLVLSPRTVETHVHRSLAKLGLHNRAGLAGLVAQVTARNAAAAM